KNLGQDVLALGLVGGFVGETIEEKLQSQRISIAFKHIDGLTRTNIILTEPNGRHTEVLEPGPTISESDIDQFLASYERSLSGYEIVIIGGSVPPGVREDIYKDMIYLAKSKGLFTVLNAHGPAFIKALESMPDLVKPDVRLTPDVLGISSAKPQGRKQIAQRLFSMGISKVVIGCDDGSHSVYSEDISVELTAANHKITNTVISGDAFLAGLIDALQRKRSLSEAALWAMAIEIALNQKPEKRWATPEEVSGFLSLAKLKEIS
ncbi:MAG TPA: hypothetical protein ENI11_00710, partial [Actinobacteria bacterium]|nr:hypothetical protein [Actinomycetota bacterium]